MPASSIRFVEQFHLLFLAQLARRLKPSQFVVKDGCNLRFFHRSVRYSEDMDLDVGDVGAETLRDKVDEVFASRPFAQILQARGLAVARATAPKQTDTTQRWKVALDVIGSSLSLPTKIECSRRGLDEGVQHGSVDPSLARAYRLPPLMVSHYDAGAALRQKVGALANRRETQARDVFDVHHLLRSGAPVATALPHDSETLERACANALTVDFGMFKSQVLAYLQPEDQALFDTPSVWDTVVLEVVETLKGRRP